MGPVLLDGTGLVRRVLLGYVELLPLGEQVHRVVVALDVAYDAAARGDALLEDEVLAQQVFRAAGRHLALADELMSCGTLGCCSSPRSEAFSSSSLPNLMDSLVCSMNFVLSSSAAYFGNVLLSFYSASEASHAISPLSPGLARPVAMTSCSRKVAGDCCQSRCSQQRHAVD